MSLIELFIAKNVKSNNVREILYSPLDEYSNKLALINYSQVVPSLYFQGIVSIIPKATME